MSDGLQAAAIDRIQLLTERAQERYDFVTEGNRIRATSRVTGEVRWVDKPQDYIRTVENLADFTALSKTLMPEEIWVNKNIAAFKHGQHGRVTLPLQVNPLLSQLKMFGDQKGVIRNLRRLSGSQVDISGDVIQILSNLKFETNSEAAGVVAKGDESIRRYIRSKVTAETELPDVIQFGLLIFPAISGTLHTYKQVDAMLFVDPAEGRIEIEPFPLEIERVVSSAVADVQKWIADNSGIDTYCGSIN